MSNINTNNLSVNFPVVGVNNSSQGFRDNFAAIKTNIDLAATELTDLQSKTLLKAPLTGTVLNNNMNGAPILNALIHGFRNTTYNLGTDLKETIIINLTKADVHIGTLLANSTVTLQFAGWAPVFTKCSVDVYLTVLDTNSFINLTGVNLDNSKLTLANFKDNKLSAPAGIQPGHILAYRFSTLDCGTTVTVEPITVAQKTSQLSTLRTPPALGVLGDQRGAICFDTQNVYFCTDDYNGLSVIWKRIPLMNI
jgi:hypothetical protein